MVKKVKHPAVLEIACKKCGRVTRHSLNKDGEYRCNICGSVDKKVKVNKKNLEIVFTPAFDVDALRAEEVPSQLVPEEAQEEFAEELAKEEA